MGCSPPDSSVHGIFQARILEWVAISSLRHLPDPGNELASPSLLVDSLPVEPYCIVIITIIITSEVNLIFIYLVPWKTCSRNYEVSGGRQNKLFQHNMPLWMKNGKYFCGYRSNPELEFSFRRQVWELVNSHLGVKRRLLPVFETSGIAKKNLSFKKCLKRVIEIA